MHSVVDKPVLLPGVCLWEYVCDIVSQIHTHYGYLCKKEDVNRASKGALNVIKSHIGV